MRPSPRKQPSLQQSIDSFHRSPLYQCKQQLRVEEGRLKKIGRNRLLREQPLAAFPPNKENLPPNHLPLLPNTPAAHKPLLRANGKNLSFGHLKVVNMEQHLSRMVASQKDLTELPNDHLKEALLKKQFFIRDRKLLPQRNCLSANLRKEPQGTPPQGVRDLRRARMRRSRDLKQEEEEERQLAPCQLAQRLAEEARPLTAPNASKHPLRSASLEDFLNEWRGGGSGSEG